MKLYIKEIDEEIKNNFSYKNKPAKFIILNYGNDEEIHFDEVIGNNNNIVVVNVEDLVDFNTENSEYTICENDIHPNEKAWNAIVPKLIKKLKM